MAFFFLGASVSRIPSRLIATTAALTLVSLHLNARVDLARLELQIRNRVWASAPLAPASLLAMAALNHTTFAADIAWSWSTVENAEARREGRSSAALVWNVEQLVQLDQKFMRAYEWFPAAYLMYRWPVTPSDLELVNHFMDIGIRAYPENPDLPLSAALNYMGHSAKHSVEERIRQGDRALVYLRQAAARPNAREDVTPLIVYFERRKARLEGRKVNLDSEARTYVELLERTVSPVVRKTLLASLRRLGMNDDAILSQLRTSESRLRRKHMTSSPTLPINLWLSLSPRDLP